MSEEIFGYVGIKQESAFGEESGAEEIFEEVIEDTIAMKNDLIELKTIEGARCRKNALPGPVYCAGALKLNPKPEGVLPWIFKGLFGAVKTSEIAAGVYEHVFSILDSHILPSFRIRSGFEDLAQNWLGCTFDSAAISFNRPDTLELSAGVLAQRPEEAADIASPVFSSIDPFIGADASFFFSGAADLRFESFSAVLDNAMERKHTHSGTRWCRAHVAHRFSITGSFTLEFESEAERRRLWGALNATGPQRVIEPIHLSLNISHPSEIAPGYNYHFKLDLPEILIEAAPAVIRREADRILQTVNFIPIFSRAHDKYADVVIRNGTPGYPAPA